MSKRNKSKKPKQQQSSPSFYDLISSLLVLIVAKLKLLLSHVIPVQLQQWQMSAEEKPVTKKQARLINKQNKVMAEYRLVNGGCAGERERESEEPGAKRIKLDSQGQERKLLSPEEFKQVKKELADRKKMLTQLPRFILTTRSASVFQTEYATRSPVYLPDIQHLITYAYGGNALIPPPSRWCSLQKPNRLSQLVVIMVEGLGLNEFVDNEELFPRTMGVFGGDSTCNRCIVEVLDPQWYGGSLQREVARWGLFEVEGDGDGDSSSAAHHHQHHLSQLASVFPIVPKTVTKEEPREVKDKFPRTSLVLTLPQLIQEGYPLPIPSDPMTREPNVKFIQTCNEYEQLSDESPMYAVDCEMVGAVGDANALCKIAIVDEELETVYESLVRPRGKVLDYRTRWSGITREMLEGVEVRLKDVQEKVKELVRSRPDCILVGQSLNCDLKSLRMIHPYVIDTSVCFNLTGIEGRKSKLRDLALNLLDEEIQTPKRDGGGKEGHCPVEDAAAAMKLVKAKLANDMSFGNAVKNPSLKVNEPVAKTLDNYFKEKRNTLDKNVLVIQHTRPASAQDSDSEDDASSTSTSSSTATQPKLSLPLLYHKSNNKPPSAERSKIHVAESPSNRSTIKLLSASLFDNYMSIAHYRINGNYGLGQEANKLDKRVHKVFNKMCDNSMMVVVCSSAVKKEEDDCGKRRNNGVCMVRVKVAGNKRN